VEPAGGVVECRPDRTSARVGLPLSPGCATMYLDGVAELQVRGTTMNAILWKVLAALSAVGAAQAADKTLTLIWRGATGDKPPTVPEDPETNWTEALAWAALSGAVMGVARMLATRQAAQYYVKSTGKLPKALIRD
jgi:hypothetical protein